LTYQAGLSITLLSNNAKMYCEKLFSKTRSNIIGALTANGVIFFDEVNSHVYDKRIYNKQVFKTINYNHSKKWNDSIVQLKSGKIVQIKKIMNMGANLQHCDKNKKINVTFASIQ